MSSRTQQKSSWNLHKDRSIKAVKTVKSFFCFFFRGHKVLTQNSRTRTRRTSGLHGSGSVITGIQQYTAVTNREDGRSAKTGRTLSSATAAG